MTRKGALIALLWNDELQRFAPSRRPAAAHGDRATAVSGRRWG